MQISLTYNELSSEIKKRTNLDIEMEYISWNKVKVTAYIKVPIIGRQGFGTTVEVVEFEGLTLNLKSPSDTLLDIASKFIKIEIPEYIKIEDSEIKVHLEEIDKLKKVFEAVRPTRLHFDENKVYLDGELL